VARILYCGDCNVQTGFGRVAENLLPALAKEHEIHVLAVNYWGDPHDMPFSLYPAMVGGSDPFGSHRLPELIARVQPDLVFAVNDIWVLKMLWDRARPYKEQFGFKWYGYFPVDSYGFFPEVFHGCEEWDGMGTYTKFGLEEVRKAGCKLPCDVIAHGIDRATFFPIDRNEARQELGIPEDQFIVFNGNRNQPRKRIDLTIKAFIEFALDKPDARLWLNMGVKDQGWDIVSLFKRMARDYGYSAEGKLILTSKDFDTTRCLPVERLNMVYNACDIGINTCIGEGWGLVNFEHAATRTAQLVPDHTSLAEIFDGIPRIPTESWEVDKNYGLDRGVPSASGAAKILDYYYNNREELQANADWCYEQLCQDRYSWATIGEQMKGIVKRTLEGKPTSGEGFGKKHEGVGAEVLFPGASCKNIDLSDGKGVYCISLDGSKRRPVFEQQANAVGQGFQWWRAIDARGKQREKLEALTDRPVIWDSIGGHDALRRGGELALTLSSIALWQHAVEQGFDYLAVMEDDTKLTKPLCLPVPEDADLLFFNNRSGRNLEGFTWGMVCGTDGYIATKQGLKKLLTIFSSLYLPVDLQMIAHMESMKDYDHHLVKCRQEGAPLLRSYTMPPIAFHGSFSSDIR
jgi:D-inositol-3-phosphate glycosyltransferase